MSNLEGQTFAGYEILSKLGEGGMGAVYKARQPMLNRLVALKVMSPSLSGDPAFVARFIREASAAANLNHPNMVQVYTAGESDKIYHIVMEFVEGESLRVRLDRMERLPPQEAVAITVYVAQALQYAWNKAHLIHRDIKPDNIFLSNAGEVKVGDLGLAKSVGGSETTGMTQTGMVMGSPHYISPEQAQGAKDIDFRADIYSLGCTLYHMLTGRTPYEGDSSMAIMMKHINEPPPAIFRVWSACPMPLGRLVGKMVAKRRQERHASYEELVADLMQVHEKLRQSESVAPVATTPAPTGGGAAVAETVPKAKATDTGVTTRTKMGNQKLIYAAGGVCALVALAGVLWWAPWKTGEAASGKRQAEAGLESRLQAESAERQPAKAGTPTAAPAEPARQEPVAPITSPALVVSSAPPPPVADSARITPQPAMPTASAPFDAAQARRHQEAWAKHLQVPVEMTNSIGMKFVLIPPGEFLMGSTPEERDRALDEASKVVKGRFYPDRIPGEVPQHRIRITKPFYLGAFEVTQEEYEQLAGRNSSQFSARGRQAAKVAGMDTRRFPVEEVSFEDASQFAGRLSERAREKSAGWKYRLPTEAEWEYACRAGTATRYHFGDDPSLLGDYGWFLGNSDHRTHPVGEKRPNAWGLHDMHGNVLEWCQDWFSTIYFAESPADDPPGPPSGSSRVERGGTMTLYPVGCRSAARHFQESSKPNYIGAGFRLVCEIPTSAEPKSATTPSTPAALPSQPPASPAQAPTSPSSVATGQTTDGFQPLFNCRDLTGWVPMASSGRNDTEHQPTTGGWNVQDGELVCATSQTGWLKTERQYGDYVLRLEFKLLRDSNSDVYIRCPTSGHIARVGMAIQIIDPNYQNRPLPPKKQIGSIYDVVGTDRPPVRPLGEWNTMEIRCEGDNVEVTLNGTRTASANMSQTPELQNRPRTGYIGIGNWHGEANGMSFRNIRIKELGAVKASSGETKLLDLGGGVNMELVAIPPGEFMQGSTKEEQAWAAANGLIVGWAKNEGKAPRKAAIKQGFWLGRTEMTVGQWKQFAMATGYKTDAEKKGFAESAPRKDKGWGRVDGASWRDPGFGAPPQDNHPVCCISWDDAMAFCKWLTVRERQAGRLPAGHVVRLPTEAEWEYACRAGTQTKFWWGDSTEDGKGRLNWNGTEDGFEFAAPVDSFGEQGRNPFGLADILGNVFEWCLDDYDETQAHEDLWRGNAGVHAVRGGSFHYGPAYGRCAFRGVSAYVTHSSNGLRVAVGVDVSGVGTSASSTSATAAREGGIQAPAETNWGLWEALFDGKSLAGWRVPDAGIFARHGDVRVENGELVLRKGERATAAAWAGEFPSVDYELTFELKLPCPLVSFPVGTSQWGFFAGEQSVAFCPLRVTRSSLSCFSRGAFKSPFEKGKWHLIRLRVAAHKITVSIDGQERFQFDTTPHEEQSRGGDDTLKPLAVFTWQGDGAIRAIRFTKLGATTTQSAINLLPLIDPQKDAVAGEWKLTGDGLVLERPSGAGVLDLPYAPPEEYDFEIEFTPTSGGYNVNQYLAATGRSFAWKLDAHNRKPPLYGFEMLDGKLVPGRNETMVQKTISIEPGRRCVSRVEVRRGSLRTLVNGEEYVKWSGDFSRLSLENVYKLRDASHIGVGSYQRGVIFHRIEVREVTGKGTFARGAPSAASATRVDDAFAREVAALPPVQQVARVVAKLKELNPNFDGKETHKIEDGAVTVLNVSTMGVTDITPIQALKSLKQLAIVPWGTNQRGSLSDLSALKGMPLTWLYCQNNPISDLSPLKGLPLTVLGCGGTRVSDLSPLAGMKLNVLSINDTAVSDLSPLSGMPLTVLWCNNTSITDFTPLKNSPLQELRCDFQPQRDAGALRGIPTLRKINDQPAAALLKQAAASMAGGDIHALIVTGVDVPVHDWRSTGPAIRNELQKDPRMKVEILNDIYQLDSTDLTKFQVVLLNFYTKGKPDPNEQAKENLKNFVNRGGGLVVFHSTCGSFSDWPEFRDLAGKIMNHQKPAMDKLGPMRVKIANPNHPITRGMQSYETTDELYAFLSGRKPVEILATAHAKSTGSDEPMAFILNYGKGRVFHFVLGHDVRAIEMPGTAELLRRGAAWVAGREPAATNAVIKR